MTSFLRYCHPDVPYQAASTVVEFALKKYRAIPLKMVMIKIINISLEIFFSYVVFSLLAKLSRRTWWVGLQVNLVQL
ncbi:MAG: hypothetical protein KatS3mg087_0812 [Patescibacteria group bacterium]|nr:MAG: hypothetical protein KatS3mg087_0812 [Patescibacteria group bacterium]